VKNKKEREKSFIEKKKITGKKFKNGRKETVKKPTKAVHIKEKY
jgi:hypothetical protein